MNAAEIVFWVCLFLVAYTYFLYPVILFACYAFSQTLRDLRYLNGRENRRCAIPYREQLPSVTLVIPAYNEREHLPAKIDNIRQLDYPEEKLEVVFVSDGSTDGTNAILEKCQAHNFKTILLAERRGKPTALNLGVERAQNDILVFTDAATVLAPDTVKKLVRHFREPSVGVVCGALQFQGNSEHQRTEGVYWRYESALRVMEARLGATLTASGAIYAIRKRCYPKLAPDVLIEDFVVPMNVRRAGYRVIYDPEARATDFGADSVADEFTRRVRLAIGSFKALGNLISVPVQPYTVLAFVSHKMLRWIIPFLLIGLLVSNLFLLQSPVYKMALTVQFLFYLWAAVGYALRGRVRQARYALMGYFLFAIHLAYLVGFARFLTGRVEVKWRRV